MRSPSSRIPSDPLHSGLVRSCSSSGVDWSNTWYARAALMWKPGDDWKFTLTYQHQTDQSGGYSQTNPAYRYDQTLYVDQPGAFQTDLGSFDVSKDAGFATASSNSSLTSQSSTSEYDLTGLFESVASYYGNYPRNLSPIYITVDGQGLHRGAAPGLEGFRSLGLGRGRLLQRPPADAGTTTRPSRGSAAGASCRAPVCRPAAPCKAPLAPTRRSAT
jgi:hypothetical protein